MKHFWMGTLVLGVVLCGVLDASAQGPPGGRPRPGGPGAPDGAAMLERMKGFDSNGDGQLERSELPAGVAERLFARADADGDDMISETELQNAFPASGRGQGRPTEPVVFEVGKPAPDVELKLLAQIEDPEGKRSFEVTEETLQISSLEGEQVVCLFLSSYT